MNTSTPDTSSRYIGLPRRVGAFALDFLIIAGYILLVLAIGFGFRALMGEIPLLASPLAMDVLAFTALVLPVILYFTLQEGSSRQATWGKRRIKMKVVDAQGAGLNFWQALVRSVVKFLPWQIAHTSIIHIWFGDQSPVFLAGAVLSEALVVVYLLCLWLDKKHRAPYDWIAGSFVNPAE
jgi:uncharacterized RDD family membrane protein YckC